MAKVFDTAPQSVLVGQKMKRPVEALQLGTQFMLRIDEFVSVRVCNLFFVTLENALKFHLPSSDGSPGRRGNDWLSLHLPPRAGRKRV